MNVRHAGAAALVSMFVLVTSVGAARAMRTDTPTARDLPVSSVSCPQQQPSNSPEGTTVALPGGAYRASLFPTPLALTLPGGGWWGGQWKTGSTGCRIGEYGIGRKPFYGWVALRRGADPEQHRGSILIMTSYAVTPSVAGVISLLLSNDRGVSYRPPVPVKAAGLSGRALEGGVDALHHQFFAFTKPGAAAGAHADGVDLPRGALFRILVLDAHGKTVVVYLSSGSLPAARFPTFLTSADRVLAAARFPRG